MYLLYFDHNDDSYSRKWMRKINFFTHAILRTLLRRFCAPFLFTLHYYLRMLWCTYAYKTIWLYYSIKFLSSQTYLLMLQTPYSKITNYWFKTYELLIQNLRTFDTKPTNYQSFLIQTPDSNITNYQSFLLALTRSKDRRWCWEKDSPSLNCHYLQNEKS